MSLWQQIKDQLKQQIPDESFREWFADTWEIRAETDTIWVGVPEPYFADFIHEYYMPFVRQAATVAGISHDVRFTSDTATDSPEPSHPVTPVASAPAPGTPRPHFNPMYTFSSFVVGPTNELAYATSRAVADNPGFTYNPLFIYGGTGLGKTHLLHAIGHHVLEHNPAAKILFYSAERFTTDYIQAVRTNRMDHFRARYRSADITLVDDIHILAGKPGTQEEFFNTFNELFDRQKQIVLSSDSLPKDIPKLEERLMTRFSWGIIADIQPPELEIRIAILQKKAEKHGVFLPEEVALFIAKKVRRNVRELEGALNKVVAMSRLNDKPLSVALARQGLRSVLIDDDELITPKKIMEYVANYYKLPPSRLKEKTNVAQVVLPRQIAMYLCKTLTNLSYPEIGKFFGKKHHTTVLYAVNKIQKRINEDPKFARLIESFKISIR